MDLSKHKNPEGKNGNGGYTRRDFLKADDIPTKGGLKATVIEFREAPKGMPYSDFLLDIKTSDGEYTVGLRSKSVLLDMLIEKLGPQTDKWDKAKITFVRGGNKGQYVNVAN